MVLTSTQLSSSSFFFCTGGGWWSDFLLLCRLVVGGVIPLSDHTHYAVVTLFDDRPTDLTGQHKKNKEEWNLMTNKKCH